MRKDGRNTETKKHGKKERREKERRKQGRIKKK
jgi:hypothetical protein